MGCFFTVRVHQDDEPARYRGGPPPHGPPPRYGPPSPHYGPPPPHYGPGHPPPHW